MSEQGGLHVPVPCGCRLQKCSLEQMLFHLWILFCVFVSSAWAWSSCKWDLILTYQLLMPTQFIVNTCYFIGCWQGSWDQVLQKGSHKELGLQPYSMPCTLFVLSKQQVYKRSWYIFDDVQVIDEHLQKPLQTGWACVSSRRSLQICRSALCLYPVVAFHDPPSIHVAFPGPLSAPSQHQSRVFPTPTLTSGQ